MKKDSKEYELKLKSKAGKKDQISYQAISITQTMKPGNVQEEKTSITDFTIVEESLPSLNPNEIKAKIKTLKKNGPAGLRDMAFPELGQSINVTYSPYAEVLKAGDEGKNSVFYVPPVSLPKEKVSVGDTWVLDAQWIGETSELPFKMEIVTILKDVKPCRNFDDQCAELEVSGEVEMLLPANSGIYFLSQLSGRIWFAINSGKILSSNVRSQEKMQTSDGLVRVASCIGSELERADRPVASCDPGAIE